jgi:L-ascorbate metabolism protein UlaG (beta-lactamase superfamily)
MKLRYYGHSFVGLETRDATILIDPFVTGNPSAEPVVSVADLRPDVILLTHAHGDHWGDTPRIAAQSEATVIACFEIAECLSRKHGYSNVVGTNTGGSVEQPWGRVTFTHARHSSSFPDGTYGGVANGVVVQADDCVVYHAGDTAPFLEMEWIGDSFPIDVALLPIGDLFTMGTDESIRAVRMLHPEVVVPVHFNTWPPIEVQPEALKRWAANVAEAGSIARVLAPGESFDV